MTSDAGEHQVPSHVQGLARLYVESWKNGNAPDPCCRPRRTYVAFLHDCTARYWALLLSLVSGLLLVDYSTRARQVVTGGLQSGRRRLGTHGRHVSGPFHLLHCRGDVPSRRVRTALGSTTGPWTADEDPEKFWQGAGAISTATACGFCHPI